MKGFNLILIKLKWKKVTSVYQQAVFLACCSFLLDKFVHLGVGSTRCSKPCLWHAVHVSTRCEEFHWSQWVLYHPAKGTRLTVSVLLWLPKQSVRLKTIESILSQFWRPEIQN